jgi:hypothetical protein
LQDCYFALPPVLELELELDESLEELAPDLAFLPPSASEICLPILASGFVGVAGLVVFGVVLVAVLAEEAVPDVDELLSVDELSVAVLPSVEVLLSVETSAAAAVFFDAADEAVPVVADFTAPSTSLTTVSTAVDAALTALVSELLIDAALTDAADAARLSEMDVEM